MIYHKKLFREIFSLSIIIAGLHYYATINSLYWSIGWFDILMHFLGGLLMGLIAIFIFFISEKIDFPRNSRIVIFSVVMGFVLIVGLTWELWELFAGLSDVINDLGDTILDLIMDIIGGVIAYLLTVKKIWIKN
jgi:hypothetical protein